METEICGDEQKTPSFNYVIVGGGIAGVSCAEMVIMDIILN